MKPPRVYVRGKFFWVEYWNPQAKKKVRKPIQDGKGLSIESDNPDWKLSKRKREIKAATDEIAFHRMKLTRWETTEPKKVRDLSLDDLLKRYNDERERLGGSVEWTATHNFESAIKWLKKSGVRSIRELTSDKVLELRRMNDLAPASLQSYFNRLRPMFAFAVKQKFTADNPFEGVKVKVAKTPPKGMPLTKQIENFQKLYDKSPMLCAQVLYLRLGGYRAKDSTTLETTDLDFEHMELNVLNNKGKRRELNPMSRAMAIVLRWAVKGKQGKVFPIRDPHKLYDDVQYITGQGVHVYKKCFADELAPFTDSDDLKRYLLHHQAESMAMLHYQKPPVEQGRKVLNEAQTELEKWVQNRYTT